MKAAWQPVFEESRFCASCHQYQNPDTGVPAQSTYEEWLSSPFGNPDAADYATCQDCHMQRDPAPGRLCDPPTGFGEGPDRPIASHASHAIEGVTLERLIANSSLALAVSVSDGQLVVSAEVGNHGAGHHLPTGVSLRNMILRIGARAPDGMELDQVSGETVLFTDPMITASSRMGTGRDYPDGDLPGFYAMRTVTDPYCSLRPLPWTPIPESLPERPIPHPTALPLMMRPVITVSTRSRESLPGAVPGARRLLHRDGQQTPWRAMGIGSAQHDPGHPTR